MGWAGQESAKMRESFLFSQDSAAGGQSGTLDLDGKSIQWTRNIEPLSGLDLYAVRISAEWTEAGRPLEFHHEIYGYKKDLSQII